MRDALPYLSGAGRLVTKDAIMLRAALVSMADSEGVPAQTSCFPPTLSNRRER